MPIYVENWGPISSCSQRKTVGRGFIFVSYLVELLICPSRPKPVGTWQMDPRTLLGPEARMATARAQPEKSRLEVRNKFSYVFSPIGLC